MVNRKGVLHQVVKSATTLKLSCITYSESSLSRQCQIAPLFHKKLQYQKLGTSVCTTYMAVKNKRNGKPHQVITHG